MEMWNFNDTSFLILFFIVIIAIFLIAFTSALFLISSIKENDFLTQLSYERDTTIIYIIDVRKNRMVSFNKGNMKNKNTSDVLSFYTRFHPNDIEKVKSWIFSIYANYKTAEQYLEADILLNNGKKPCFSLLKLIKYDPENGLVHIESRILKYITPNNAPKAKKTKKTPTGIIKRSQILQMINKNKSYIGSYPSEELAARIYDILALKNRGIKARTNFIYNSKQIKKICEMEINIKSENINDIISQLIE